MSPSYPRLPIEPGEVARAREWRLNRTEDLDLADPVITWVERAADPDSPAVADDGVRLTYAQLATRARRLATRLTAFLATHRTAFLATHCTAFLDAGPVAGPDDGLVAGLDAGARPVVAVGGRRCAAVVEAFLAIELVGAVYLPVDGSWPARRVRDVLTRAGAVGVLAADPSPALVEGAAAAGCPVLPLDGDDRTHGDGRNAGPVLGAPRLDGPDQPRYVLYTSGSTGAPKGAVVEHRGMLNHLLSKVLDLGLGPHDVVAQTAPLGFDISLWQLLAPLLAGGQVRVLPDGVAQDPAALVEAVDRLGITVLELVPTLMGLLLDRLATSPGRLEGLRWLLATGEELPAGTARRWLDAVPHAGLLNAYGPTECSDDVTHHRIGPDDLDLGRLPIGTPVANTSLYVLRWQDGRWHACEPGEVGELFVGGAGVGRGYLGDPERTAECFFQDPFDATPTGRLYRTGDAVRLLPRGCLQYLGRVDRQVKISGVRVELGEIEAILARHPGVRACAVVAHDVTSR